MAHRAEELVKKAVEDGQLVVVGRDGQLKYSNQVPFGDTGIPTESPRREVVTTRR